MDVKKTYKADLDNRRVSGFLLGLVVALSVFLVALEFTTRSGLPEADDNVLDDVSQDIEMMPAVNRDDMVSASQGGKKGSSGRFKVVERKAEAPEAGDIRSDHADLKGLLGVGLGEATDIASAEIKPAVVAGNDDNPLNFTVVERLPEFPGGYPALMQWLTKNLKYPVTAQRAKRQGTVLVSFIINKDGSITDRKVVKSASPELDREALRVLRNMPKWKPGEDRGKPCRTYFCIPIVFKL